MSKKKEEQQQDNIFGSGKGGQITPTATPSPPSTPKVPQGDGKTAIQLGLIGGLTGITETGITQVANVLRELISASRSSPLIALFSSFVLTDLFQKAGILYPSTGRIVREFLIVLTGISVSKEGLSLLKQIEQAIPIIGNLLTGGPSDGAQASIFAANQTHGETNVNAQDGDQLKALLMALISKTATAAPEAAALAA